MSTSDINRKDRAVKASYIYLFLSILCMIFGLVYGEFGHGVYSRYMIYAFMFPLIGGAFPFLTLYIIPAIPYPGKITRDLWHCGIATITIGSLVRGALNVYGTVNPMDKIYGYVAVPLVAIAAIMYIISLFTKKKI